MDFRETDSIEEKVELACKEIRAVLDSRNDLSTPEVGLILGTGMGGFASEIQNVLEIPYESITGFQRSTVSGHTGKLLFGQIGRTSVVAMSGRCHFYEGYSIADVCLPILVLKALGIHTLIIGNASGGLNPNFNSGEVMIIRDHLDLMFQGGNSLSCDAAQFPAEYLGRPTRRVCYSTSLIERAQSIARESNLVLHQGVYAALSGPTYETRSEYRMLRRLGADAVGMSTIPEANMATALGIHVCGLSTITNVARPDVRLKTTHQEVITAVESAEKSLKRLLKELLTSAAATLEPSANKA